MHYLAMKQDAYLSVSARSFFELYEKHIQVNKCQILQVQTDVNVPHIL